jgi:hypothetical protein
MFNKHSRSRGITVPTRHWHCFHCGRLSQPTVEVKASSPVARNGEVAAGDSCCCLLPEGKRKQTRDTAPKHTRV